MVNALNKQISEKFDCGYQEEELAYLYNYALNLYDKFLSVYSQYHTSDSKITRLPRDMIRLRINIKKMKLALSKNAEETLVR